MKSWQTGLLFLGCLAVLGLAVWWWLTSPWVKTYTVEIAQALTFLSIVSALLVFLSLLITVSQFRTTQLKERERLISERCARIDALLSEVAVNQVVLAEILGQSEYVEGKAVPESRFEVKVLRTALALGMVETAQQRANAWDAYRLASTANSLLDQALRVLYLEHEVDPRDQLLASGRRRRIVQLMSSATETARKARVEFERLRDSLGSATSG